MTSSLSEDELPDARPPAEEKGPLSLAVDDDLALRLATFQCRNPDFARREDAARHILRLWLTENGYDGTHEDLGRRPDALNASNDD